jgi:hypothetical protein
VDAVAMSSSVVVWSVIRLFASLQRPARE